jgi:RNA polymerase sigma-70 factor, ECF subfamily
MPNVTLLADESGTEMRVEDDFARLADPFRPELLAHCYRMLGSVEDAEDALQDTLLAAWKGLAAFEGRASLRTWLYRIATNACLTALEHRTRRPLPAGLGAPSDDPEGDLSRIPAEILWLQPLPDTLVAIDAATADPASIVAARAGLRLALIAALQYLHPRQRAVLILRDVLGWRAAEVADLLDISATAVNSLLQRARTRLEQVAPDVDQVSEPSEAEQREILDRWAKAFVDADVDTLMGLLTADVVWEMPPQPMWFQGQEMVRRLIGFRLAFHARDRRMVPTSVNGQPAFAVYGLADDGTFRAESLQVITFRGDSIAKVSAFRLPGLVEKAGLPGELAE